jgi:hypothetical protein
MIRKYNRVNTELENNILKLYKEDKCNMSEISRKVGFSVTTIKDVIERNGRDKIIPNKKYTVDETYFEDINTEEKAYWLGFLYADGWIRYRNNIYTNIYAGLMINDIEHVKKFAKSIKSTHKITKRKNCYEISIYNKVFSTNLINNGCVPNKSLIIKFPEISKNFIRHFIRGYFDGDGSITITEKTLSFTICSGSEKFLQSIIYFLNFIIKKNYKIYKRNNQNLYIFIISNYDDIVRIQNYLYHKSTIYLDRKKEKFDYIKNNKEKILLNIKLYNRWRRKKTII